MLKKILENILNVFYDEQYCTICSKKLKDSKQHHFLLCDNCNKSIIYEKKYRKLDNIDVFSFALYRNNIREIIKKIKFKRIEKLKFFLSKCIEKVFDDIKKENENYILVTIPSHLKRKNKRSYNQTEIICNHFAKKHKIKYLPNLIKRVKNTKSLYKLNKEEREKELLNCFKLNKKYLKNITKDDTILIIDDIITTGSTIREYIKELRNNSISKIKVITIATTQI